MNTKLIWGGIAVAIVIAVGAYLFPRAQKVEPVAGSISPDTTENCTSQGGVQTCRYRQVLRTATTTACSIKTPGATTTLEFASLRVGTATTSATTWTLAKATSPYATTTKLGVFSLAGAAQGTMVASTTAPSTGLSSLIVDDVQIFAPNTYLVWGTAGVIYNAEGTINWGGTCQASFRSI